MNFSAVWNKFPSITSCHVHRLQRGIPFTISALALKVELLLNVASLHMHTCKNRKNAWNEHIDIFTWYISWRYMSL